MPDEEDEVIREVEELAEQVIDAAQRLGLDHAEILNRVENELRAMSEE